LRALRAVRKLHFVAIYYTPEELARALKVSGETVRARLRRGEIKGLRLGRIWRVPRDEVERLLGPEGLAALDRELEREQEGRS